MKKDEISIKRFGKCVTKDKNFEQVVLTNITRRLMFRVKLCFSVYAYDLNFLKQCSVRFFTLGWSGQPICRMINNSEYFRPERPPPILLPVCQRTLFLPLPIVFTWLLNAQGVAFEAGMGNEMRIQQRFRKQKISIERYD